MTIPIHSMIPDAEDLLALEVEELAGVLLEYLNSLGPNDQHRMNRYNFTLPHGPSAIVYPAQHRDRVVDALMEAWVWLEREGLLAPRAGQNGDWSFITRRGKSLANRKGLNAYRHASMLPRKLLHPSISQKVYPAFLRGEYDTAVFQAFREVEVAVRDGGRLAANDLGVPLMRAAFDVSDGPLTDKGLVRAEQQSMSDLFAGAIGLFKNPASHRSDTVTDPARAVELIMIASHLLRIVDERVASVRADAAEHRP